LLSKWKGSSNGEEPVMAARGSKAAAVTVTRVLGVGCRFGSDLGEWDLPRDKVLSGVKKVGGKAQPR